MNNIERFKSGDKRLQVVVNHMSDEQKILVQKGFFALEEVWGIGGNTIQHLGEYAYSNTWYDCDYAGSLKFIRQVDHNYPTTTFTELMILADMVDLPEVVEYLDEKELIKYGIKQDETMGDNKEFTKDMLKDGMFVLLRNQGNQYSKGYHLVLNGLFVNSEGNVDLKNYDADLNYISSSNYDVVEIFTSEKVTSLEESSLQENLTSIWKRQSPEEVQRLSEKAALQEDIHAMKERLKSMESKLESM